MRAAVATLLMAVLTTWVLLAQGATAHDQSGLEITLHSDNGQASGLWASGTHFYVSDPEDNRVYAYQRTGGDRATSREISLHSDNQDATGIWGDGTHLWVTDTEDKLLYAYSLQDGTRATTQDITLHADNADARGLTGWKGESNIRFLYVLDQDDNHVYAYKLENNAAAHNDYESFSIGDDTDAPWGVWENTDAHSGENETAWVTNAGRIFAHDHEDQEQQDNSSYGDRLQDKDIRLDSDNLAHRGTWSDGEFIWVVDQDDQKLYAYHLDNMRRKVSGSPNFEEGDGGLTGISKIPSGRWKGRIGEYLWVNDTDSWNTNRYTKKIHVRNHLAGGLVPSRHITLDGSNAEPQGIWSNDETIWVADDEDHILYAYHLEDKTRQEDQEFALHQGNQTPRGIWSDGTNIWVTDGEDRHVYAYNLDTGARVPELDLILHPDHQKPTGMHGIGNTIWIADLEKNLVYAYLIPNRSPQFDRPHQEIFLATAENQDGDSLGMLTATDPDGHPVTFQLTDPQGATVQIDETTGELSLSLEQGATLQSGSDTVITIQATDGRRYDHQPALPGGTDTTEITLKVENAPATGAPTISGTAWIGQVLRAKATEVADADGLPNVLTYQWIRVDSDGTSNPTNIGTDSDTYTLTENEGGKRVKVAVSFTDNGNTSEGPLISEAYPTSGKIPHFTVSFAEGVYTVVEGQSQPLTVTISADPGQTLVIPISNTNQDGATSGDYTGATDVTFESGDTEKEIAFSATQDTVDDDGESVKLSFGNLPDGVSAGTNPETTVFITDDDFPSLTVTFENQAYTVTESDDLTTTQVQENQASIKVTLSANPERAVTVPITKANQGDTTASDYSGVPIELDFNSEDTEKTITFSATHDEVDDDGDSVKLTFGNLPQGMTAGANDEAVVEITDDDDPAVTIRFEQASYTVAEGNIQDIKIILNADPERTISFPLTLTEQGGAESTDYTVPASVVFNSGDTEKTIAFEATQDTVDDDDESVKLGFGTMPTGTSAASPDETTVNIADDDVPQVSVSFSADTYTAPEGGSAQVKVTLSEAPERQVVVIITKANQGGATDPDYSGVPEDLTFEAEETEMSITFEATDDSEDDDDESVKLTFGAFPPGVSAGTNSEAVVNITDSDVPTVTVSFKESSYTVDEGNTVTVTVELSADPERSVEIPIMKAEQGGATSIDYSGVPEEVTFQTGETEKTFDFAATSDTVDDDEESVKLTFGDLPDGVNPGTKDNATVSITDDDYPADISVSFEQNTYTASEGQNVEVKLTLSQAPERTVTVHLDTNDQDGAVEDDYSGVPGMISFAAEETEKTFTFEATQDSLDDDDESVEVALGTLPAGLSEGTNPRTVIGITDDDDPAITVSFEQAVHTVAESDDPSTTNIQENTATIKVKLSADPERTVTIRITTGDEGESNNQGQLNPASNQDYSGVPESLTFNPGDTERTIAFAATHDGIDEGEETVKLGFGPNLPTGVSKRGITETTVSITDDDTTGVTVKPASLTVSEGGTNTYTVVLDSQPTQTVTVTINDPADNTDVTADPTNLAFTTGDWSTAQTVTVTAAQDDNADDETTTITHTVGGYQTVTAAEDVTVTVTDDAPDSLTIRFEKATYTVDEGDSVTIKVKLNTDPKRTVTVPISKDNQGGVTSNDYSGVPTQVTFLRGDTEKEIPFAAASDNYNDDGESVKLGFEPMPRGVNPGTMDETTVNIMDDDVPDVTANFERSQYTVSESDDASTTGVKENEVTIKVVLSADPERTVTIQITKAEQDGATSGDYSGVPTTR